MANVHRLERFSQRQVALKKHRSHPLMFDIQIRMYEVGRSRLSFPKLSKVLSEAGTKLRSLSSCVALHTVTFSWKSAQFLLTIPTESAFLWSRIFGDAASRGACEYYFTRVETLLSNVAGRI